MVYDYADPPRDAHYVLSKRQFETLRSRLIGLPIRVEHANNTVGRVVAASLEGERELVEWELEDNASGWAAAKLTDLNAVRELSLKHIMYADGRLEPVEISLCEQGARPGTIIVKASSESSAQYKARAQETSKEEARGPVSATMATPADSVAVVPPAAATAPVVPAVQQQPATTGAAAPAVAVAPAVTNDATAPAAGVVAPNTLAPVNTESADAAAAGGVKRKRLDDPIEFLKTLSGKITDAEALQAVAELIGEAVEDKIATQHEVDQLRQAKALLEKAQESSKESAKTIVSDVVSVLSDLYSRFAPNVKLTDEQKAEFSNVMEANPTALNYVRPLVVAASAIQAAQTASNTVHVHSNNVLDQAIAKIAALQGQLGTAKRMNAPVAVHAAAPVPQWTQAQAAAAIPAPAVVAAAPMVEVAASGNALSRIQLPAILQNLPCYDSGSGLGRVTADMFARKLVTSPGPLPGPVAGSM